MNSYSGRASGSGAQDWRVELTGNRLKRAVTTSWSWCKVC